MDETEPDASLHRTALCQELGESWKTAPKSTFQKSNERTTSQGTYVSEAESTDNQRLSFMDKSDVSEAESTEKQRLSFMDETVPKGSLYNTALSQEQDKYCKTAPTSIIEKMSQRQVNIHILNFSIEAVLMHTFYYGQKIIYQIHLVTAMKMQFD